MDDRRMIRHALATTFALLLALPAAAQPTARIQPLYDALKMGELLAIMREEGMGYGDDLREDLFPGRGDGVWELAVDQIYGQERLESAVGAGLDAELSDDEISAIVDFFETDRGERIVTLEVAARRAMLDEKAEEAALQGWEEIEDAGGRRWELSIEFADANDLVESNVAGAMTSNYAFYMGLMDGKAFDYEMTEEEVLSDVWSQEPAIREETVDWVFSFISLAYQPLSDEDFEAYVQFAKTEEGQALNSALFNVFNSLFAQISGELGLGAARFMAGQDI